MRSGEESIRHIARSYRDRVLKAFGSQQGFACVML